jgi:hypothetical protein
MALHEPIAIHQAGAHQLRSYRGEVSVWSGKIMRRYVMAVVVLLLGALFLLTAGGFGVAAGFHCLAIRYGWNVAVATLGGGFLVLGLIGALAGLGLLKRSLPPLPRPTRQLQAFRRAAALDLLTRGDQMQSLARRSGLALPLGAAGTAGVILFLAYKLAYLRRRA